MPCLTMKDIFLASDEAHFIDVTDILIDGGRTQLYHERAPL